MSSAPACGEGKESVAAASSPPAQQQGSSVSIVASAVAVCSLAAPAFYWFLGKGPTPPSGTLGGGPHNLELQLMTPSCYAAAMRSTEVPSSGAQHELDTELRLSIGDVVEQQRAGRPQ
jgi:hypothetical protein